MWDDFKFYLRCVKDKGVIPWIWADHFWYNPEGFVENVPKDVLLSPWYYDNIYGNDVDRSEFKKNMRESLKKLSDYGYNQVPCGSNVWRATAMDHLIQYSIDNIESSRLLGYLATSWYPTIEEYSMVIRACLHLTKTARKKYYEKI